MSKAVINRNKLFTGWKHAKPFETLQISPRLPHCNIYWLQLVTITWSYWRAVFAFPCLHVYFPSWRSRCVKRNLFANYFNSTQCSEPSRDDLPPVMYLSALIICRRLTDVIYLWLLSVLLCLINCLWAIGWTYIWTCTLFLFLWISLGMRMCVGMGVDQDIV